MLNPPTTDHDPETTEPAATGTPSPTEPARTRGHDRLWAALCAQPGATAAELAVATGQGRSTVSKTLAVCAAEGRVDATPGATARAAHRWTARPHATAHHSRTGDDTADVGATGTPDNHTAATTDPTQHDGPEPGSDSSAPEPEAGPGSGAAGRSNRSGTARLRTGQLHGMVEDYLAENPGEHGPVEIGKALGRSSGAVANALEKLAAAGTATRTSQKPRRYQHTSTGH